MSKQLQISVAELLISALKACVAMVPWLDIDRMDKAKEMFGMCDAPIVEFNNYVLNTLPNALHFGEPLLFAISLVNHPGFEPTDEVWAMIQYELSEICTEEWLELVCNSMETV